jgi:predicted permease
VSQVAVSLVLLICAGLFVRSMHNFSGMDLGFRSEGRLIMSLDAGLRGLEEEEGRLFFKNLIERVRNSPGVRSAALGTTVPIDVRQDGTNVWGQGRVGGKEEENLLILCNRVTDGYFETMGIPLIAGRPFEETDTREGRQVAIVNDVLAEQLWPGQDPLQQRLSVQGQDGPFLDVVGVAPTMAYNLPGEAPSPFLYLPLEQSYRSLQVLHAHTDGDPAALIGTLRSVAHSLDPEMPIFDARTMPTHLREGKAALMFQLGSGLVGAFGIIGIALACIGLYGVMAYWVTQRVHELGVRMALGATAGDVFLLVLRHGVVLTLTGVALGLLGAFGITRSFANLLVGVGPTDPLTFAGVSVLLTLVAILSAYVPARRATRVDPLVALHSE